MIDELEKEQIEIMQTEVAETIETLDTVTVDIVEVDIVEEKSVAENFETQNISPTVTPTVNTIPNISPENSSFEEAKKQFAKTENTVEFLDSDYKWYCVRTYTGHENRIKQTIEAEVSRLALQNLITEIVVPEETIFEVKNGKKKTKVRNFLPGYIVIKSVDLDKDRKIKNKILDVVGGITGVVAFVGRKNDPTALQESEVERIFGRVAERSGIETIDTTYQKGDPIKIIDGPFAGFSGTMMEVDNTKQKAKIEVVILGRKTPVELDFEQIQFDKPE